MSENHSHIDQSSKNIRTAFWLNISFTIIEIIGGLYVNSVSILSDALHDLGDSLSLGASWYLQNKSNKRANRFYTFGYKRFSLLGALLNSLILIIGSVFIIREAILRLYEPELSDAQGMLFLAIIGVLVNGYAAWKLSSGKSMNEKVVSWHLLEDVLGWFAVLIASIVLIFKQISLLDPALSLAITVFVLYNVIKRLKGTLKIFLQATPADINTDEIIDKICSLDNVKSLHHTHIWSLEGENNIFTTHVLLKDIHSFDQMISAKQNVKSVLKSYDFSHFTVELELDEEDCSLK